MRGLYIWCWLKGHTFPKWSRDKSTRIYSRVCKRCGHVEEDTARTPYTRKIARPATSADTVPNGTP